METIQMICTAVPLTGFYMTTVFTERWFRTDYGNFIYMIVYPATT